MTKKNALITGVTGMVGSHLADYLLEQTNWEIYGLCRWRSSLTNVNHLLSRANAKDRITFLSGDLNDSFSLEEAISAAQPDYIFHLAAQSFPQVSFTSPIETLNTNILGTTRLLEVVRRQKLNPVIHVCASSEVFGRVSKEQLPIGEDCLFHPASPYAISKIGTDLIGRFYAEAYGMTVMTTRMFTHTGPRRGDVFAESSFAKQIALIEAKLIAPVVKVGNLESVRTITDVRDAVYAYYLLVTQNPLKGEYYNIGGTFSCSIRKILETLLGFSSQRNISFEIDPNRLRPIDVEHQIPNTEKFRNHTGWEPKIPFEKTILDLLNYWRARVAQGDNLLVR